VLTIKDAKKAKKDAKKAKKDAKKGKRTMKKAKKKCNWPKSPTRYPLTDSQCSGMRMMMTSRVMMTLAQYSLKDVLRWTWTAKR